MLLKWDLLRQSGICMWRVEKQRNKQICTSSFLQEPCCLCPLTELLRLKCLPVREAQVLQQGADVLAGPLLVPCWHCAAAAGTGEGAIWGWGVHPFSSLWYYPAGFVS